MARGRGRPRRPLSQTVPNLDPKGAPSGPLRTPLSFADADALQHEYTVEKIVAHLLKKGADWYQVRWEGLGPAADTVEPAAHLADEASQAKIKQFLEERAALSTTKSRAPPPKEPTVPSGGGSNESTSAQSDDDEVVIVPAAVDTEASAPAGEGTAPTRTPPYSAPSIRMLPTCR